MVTGSHRSGTTWVGTMLAVSPTVAHVHEPLNPVNRLSWSSEAPDHAFQYVSVHNDDRYGAAFDRIVGLHPPLWAHLRTVRSPRNAAANVRELGQLALWRARRARVLVKDPLAVFAAEWFGARYDARIVALIRHPAAFAGSLKRLGWTFDFSNLTSQPELMDDHLSSFAAEVERAARTEPDIVDQAILLWRCINSTLLTWRDRHPDWLVTRYEDLARAPIDGARLLYAHAEVPWTPDVEVRIASLTSATNPVDVPRHRTRDVRRDSAGNLTTWHQRLDRSELDRIRDGTADVAAALYPPETWSTSWSAPASSRSSSDT
jgi:hypothetical protein